MRSERFDFPNAKGEQLAAMLDLPLGPPTAYALFAHCFTCGKDNLAAKRIAERLTIHGIAVLRFDFTGLGASEGEFANTHFSSNVDDLVAAADHLRKTYGGAGDPDRPQPGRLRGTGRLAQNSPTRAPWSPLPRPTIRAMSSACSRTRSIKSRRRARSRWRWPGGRSASSANSSTMSPEKKLDDCLANLRKALLVFHSPTDDTVGIDNASHIFGAARHPKSFVSLAGADHLLSRKRRRGLCGQRDRRLGRALSRPARGHDGGRGRSRAWFWCARRMAENSSRRS